MFTLIIYWTSKTEWTLIVPLLLILTVLFIISAVQIDAKNGENTIPVIGAILCGVSMLGSMLFFANMSGKDEKEVVVELSKIKAVEEQKYHSVESMGKRAVIYNRSDNRQYVNMGDGNMISFNRISWEEMCRTCEQFVNNGSVDSVYVYRVQKEAPHWWNSDAVLYFSKEPDIFLEGSQSSPIVTAP